MIYITIIIIFLLIWALVAGLFFMVFQREKPIDKLKYYDDSYLADEKRKGVKADNRSVLRLLATFVSHFRINKKKVSKLDMELVKADIPITADELLIIKVFSSSALAFLFYALSRNFFFMIMIFILVWNIPKLIIISKKKERLKLFDSQLNEGVNVISNSLKAGYSFFQAIAVVTEETKDPFSKEFKRLIKEMSLGISEEDALKNLLSRVESEDLRLIINAILIQKDIGGNLSEILDNISETIRERQKIKNELKTLTAQGKLSGMIIILIPIFLGLAIYVFNRKYMMVLFTNPIGLAMISFSVINQILGVFMIRKIINIDM